ncbi:hypothetical protein H8959_000365 [Pygathrix nigripes]
MSGNQFSNFRFLSRFPPKFYASVYWKALQLGSEVLAGLQDFITLGALSPLTLLPSPRPCSRPPDPAPVPPDPAPVPPDPAPVPPDPAPVPPDPAPVPPDPAPVPPDPAPVCVSSAFTKGSSSSLWQPLENGREGAKDGTRKSRGQCLLLSGWEMVMDALS